MSRPCRTGTMVTTTTRISVSPRTTIVLPSRTSRENPPGLWTYDFVTGHWKQLTSEGDAASPVWSPKGDRLVFPWNIDGPYNLYTIRPNEERPIAERLTHADQWQYPFAWSPDAKFITYQQQDGKSGWVIPRPADRCRREGGEALAVGPGGRDDYAGRVLTRRPVARLPGQRGREVRHLRPSLPGAGAGGVDLRQGRRSRPGLVERPRDPRSAPELRQLPRAGCPIGSRSRTARPREVRGVRTSVFAPIYYATARPRYRRVEGWSSDPDDSAGPGNGPRGLDDTRASAARQRPPRGHELARAGEGGAGRCR